MKLKKYSPTESRVEKIAQSLISENGYSVWDIRYEKEGASWYLRVYIDSEQGIDINDCVKISQMLDKMLDSEFKEVPWDFFEVCSPGLERDLAREIHFEKYMGQSIFVKTIRPIEGVREFTGVLKEFDKENLKLAAQKDIILRFADIASVKSVDNKPYEGEEL